MRLLSCAISSGLVRLILLLIMTVSCYSLTAQSGHLTRLIKVDGIDYIGIRIDKATLVTKCEITIETQRQLLLAAWEDVEKAVGATVLCREALDVATDTIENLMRINEVQRKQIEKMERVWQTVKIVGVVVVGVIVVLLVVR